MIAINPIPAFNDNYFWLIRQGNKAIIVDPGDSETVEAYLKAHQLDLVAILITHHHWDHTDGVLALKNRHACPVYGPANAKIKGIDFHCVEGDRLKLNHLGEDSQLVVEVIEVPGHTLDHIAYYCPANDKHPNWLLCGDTIFSGGCGRLFEGTPAQMWSSMQKLKSLPKDTLIFAAHEYTQANLNFAIAVEPSNQALIDYQERVEILRSQKKTTLPTILTTEMAINPFLRADEAQVIQAARKRLNREPIDSSEVFAVIRQWKDTF